MSLIEKLSKKLEGGKFRLLNEKMYKNKELTEKEAAEYHKYYEAQVKKWPVDPKKQIIKKIEENGENLKKIADLGAGSCELAKTFGSVVSFDKYPILSDHTSKEIEVVKCDLKKITAESATFDVAVCCLSLMMSNITGVLKEVNRLLKTGGVFYLADVTSRVKNMKKFIADVEKLGFKVAEVDKKSGYFFTIRFIKTAEIDSQKRIPSVMLDDWFYKKR